jgi:hypothetical protein
MENSRSPMRMLAMKQFTEMFGDLLGVRASVGDHERVMIEHVYEQMFFQDAEAKGAWAQRVRAAHHFLDRGALENAMGVAVRFLNAGELIGLALNTAMDSKREAREASGLDPEALIRRKLSYYKDLIEGPYRVLLAPIAYAFAAVMKNGDADFMPSPDGKAKLSVLPKIERLTVYPQSQLAQGVNTHVRNAYAHSNFRILDHEHVELWDIAPARKRKPPKKWGPETWHIEKLDKLADDLEITNFAFVVALAIYAINTRQLIMARGWTRTLTRPKLTEKELRVSVQHFATELGFKSKSFLFDKGTIRIEFGTNFPGRSQDTKILLGGENYGRQLIQKIEYIDIPVIQQLLGLFQRTSVFWEHYGRIVVLVAAPSGEPLGEMSLDPSIIMKLEGPSKLSVKDARKLMITDTLGEATMSVRIEHPPVDAA